MTVELRKRAFTVLHIEEYFRELERPNVPVACNTSPKVHVLLLLDPHVTLSTYMLTGESQVIFSKTNAVPSTPRENTAISRHIAERRDRFMLDIDIAKQVSMGNGKCLLSSKVVAAERQSIFRSSQWMNVRWSIMPSSSIPRYYEYGNGFPLSTIRH